VYLAALWFVVGLLLRLFSRDLVEDIAVGFYLAGLPNYPTLFMAIFLVLLLSGMLRRQRIALLFYLIFFQLYYAAASTLLLAYYLLDYSEFITTDFLVWVILPLVTSVFYLFLGVRARPDFPAKVNGNWKRALAILVLGLAASLALVMAILYFGFHHSVREILHWTAYVLLGLSPVDVVLEPGIHVAKWVRWWQLSAFWARSWCCCVPSMPRRVRCRSTWRLGAFCSARPRRIRWATSPPTMIAPWCSAKTARPVFLIA